MKRLKRRPTAHVPSLSTNELRRLAELERITTVATGTITISDITDWPGGVSAAEVGYLSTVTSDIQTQIDNVANTDYLVEVSRGNIAGQSMVHKFGRNDDVPNGGWEHISMTPFSTANFRQSAATVRVKAGGNAADDAAGAGAREVTVQGIDSNGDETSEAITTAGASASSATTASFWRIHRAWVSSAGAYTDNNTGDIVIEDSGGAADLMTIKADEGQSQYAGYTIPSGKTGYLLGVHVTVDSNKDADIRCFTRADYDDVAAPMPAKRLRLYWDSVAGDFNYRPQGPELSLPAKTDIWFEAYGDGAACSVICDFEILLIDD